ncbi:diaminopimelate decarboxylase [Mycobacterium sp. 21AC1]|uniref:diaminopimelate decarboxylase n=1 Tax=[Mycobacterium] appelbergii TaxID=2939269 RepID=UPI0029392D5B|nr:diaminopimelate decarboxylase [Mycobacterium sp. 21AC1]MDV3125981.1 diaminopimelate decarboxylase [Mycobacterium sp. 21AC1]
MPDPGTRRGDNITGSAFAPVLPAHASISARGELVVAGCAVTDLRREYGTPLYVFDEKGIRDQAQEYRSVLTGLWPNSAVLFASKAFPCVAMYRLAAEEGLKVDVAGGGELYLALCAGVEPEDIYLHGNAKTDAELAMAVDAGVGTIIVDNDHDIDRLERLVDREQRVLLRVIPDVSPDTHASQSTGGATSKFGLPRDQALRAIDRMMQSPRLRFEGVHVHIGSQILSALPFAQSIRALSAYGEYPVYDLGGGLGVQYTRDEPAPSVSEYLGTVAEAAKRYLPDESQLLVEPGRAMVARAGITLYSVTTVKTTMKTFVAVDGGMSDHLDAALTDQRYEAIIANRMNDTFETLADVVGRQCESGDLLVGGAMLNNPRRDDVLAILATGAYSYTFANNYNGALKPAIVFCRDGDARLVTRRETYEDLARTHLVPEPTTARSEGIGLHQ